MGRNLRNSPLPPPIVMTDGKSLPPPRSLNVIPSSSHLAPPSPYNEDIEHGINETSPLNPGRLPLISLHFPFLILYSSKSHSLHRSKGIYSEPMFVPYQAEQSPNTRLRSADRCQSRSASSSWCVSVLLYLTIPYFNLK